MSKLLDKNTWIHRILEFITKYKEFVFGQNNLYYVTECKKSLNFFFKDKYLNVQWTGFPHPLA